MESNNNNIMELILSIGFNSLLHNTYFEINNPPVVPIEGELFDCHWADFIQDKEAIDTLEDHDDNGVWITHIVSKHYFKNKVVIHVQLFEEQHYEKPW